MAAINGSDVYISLGGVKLNGMTSTSYDEMVDMIETTNNDDSKKKTYIAGDSNDTFTMEGIVDISDTYGITEARTAKNAKAEVAFVWGNGVISAGGQVLSGNCLISKVSQSVPRNDKVTYSIECQVTGGTTEGTSATTIAE